MAGVGFLFSFLLGLIGVLIVIVMAPADKQVPVAAGSGLKADELKKFAEMHREGILSDEEFQKIKTRILG